MGWRNEISLRDQEIPWDSLLSVLAHEYGHTVEYVLASDNTYAATWIREGFADWVAAKVMHFLGWYEYAGSLHRARQELLRHKDLLPELSLLEIDRYWDGFSKKPKGSIRTYRYAFMAVDGLIQKKGLKSLIGYLQSGRFQDSFGFSLSDFEAELRHDLFNVAPMIHEKFKIQKPDWKIGYKWTYVRKRPGSKETVVREIVREDVFEGFPSFVMRTGKDENFYVKDVLSVLAVISDGKLISRRRPPNQLLSWPLTVGKEWKSSFTLQNVERKLSLKEDFIRVASDFGQVSIPAGTFEAMKIDTYEFDTGMLTSELWYSPKVGWFVKMRRYGPAVLEEEEMASFKAD